MKKRILATALVVALVGVLPSTMIYAKEAITQKEDETYVIGVDEQVTLDYGKIEPEDYTWESSDEDVVSSTEDGTAIGNAKGIAHINCYNAKGDMIRKYKVQVKDAPTKIKLKTNNIAEFPKRKIDLAPSVNKGATCNKFKFKSSNKKAVVVSESGVVKTKAKGNAIITVSTYNGITQKVKVRVKDPNMAVAITFDDGPKGNNTKTVLDVLKKYDYHATFFMVGENVGSNAKIVKRMVKEGNEIGTHTWGHIDMSKKSKDEIKKNVKSSINAIKNASGQKPTVLRPPYGAKNATVLSACKDLGLPVIMWNVDTNDWRSQNKSNAKVKSLILSMTKPGKVVLLHDIHPTSVQGFKAAVPELKKKGYELVTVSELVELHGGKLKAGEVFFGY